MTEKERTIKRLATMYQAIDIALNNTAFYALLSENLDDNTNELLNIDVNQVQNILQQMRNRIRVVRNFIEANK